jgi:hypothetical protein
VCTAWKTALTAFGQPGNRLFRSRAITAAFSPFSHQTRLLNPFGKAPQNAMKIRGRSVVNNVCKSCGKRAENLWIRGGEGCGILVEKRRISGGKKAFGRVAALALNLLHPEYLRTILCSLLRRPQDLVAARLTSAEGGRSLSRINKQPGDVREEHERFEGSVAS